MKYYIVLVCADCNDGDYAYRAEVISEERLSDVKEMLKSIEQLRKTYEEFYSKYNVYRRDYFPSFSNISEALEDYEYETGIRGEVEDEWIEKVSREDIDNFFSFCDYFLPHGTSDLDYMPHSLENVTAYSLENDVPITLL